MVVPDALDLVDFDGILESDARLAYDAVKVGGARVKAFGRLTGTAACVPVVNDGATVGDAVEVRTLGEVDAEVMDSVDGKATGADSA